MTLIIYRRLRKREGNVTVIWRLKIRVHYKNVHQVLFTLTFRTSLAWNSGVQLWWMKPMPPVNWEEKYISVNVSWSHPNNRITKTRTMCVCVILTAIAMAMFDSVTVSMGDDTKGVFMVIFLVSADVKSWTMETINNWGWIFKDLNNRCPVQCRNSDYSDYDQVLINLCYEKHTEFDWLDRTTSAQMRLCVLVNKF